MSLTPLGNLCLIDGWIFDTRWLSQYEGPYTALAKLAVANVVNPKELCRAFGARFSDTDGSSVHGRSLLDMNWVRAARGASGALAAQMRRRCLAQISDRWWRALSSDRHFRFCPRCIANGFQSQLCQLDGLTRCPLHGDLIVECCTHCGAATPRYAITRESFEQPMACNSCGRPYAPCWDRGAGFGNWSEPLGAEAYGPLGRWLHDFEQIECVWPDQGAWLVDPTDEGAERKKRVCMFALLSRLCPSRSVPISVDVDVQHFDFPAAEPGCDLALNRDRSLSARRQIYKSIRRHYRTALGASHRMVWNVREDLVWDYPHTVIMPASRRVGPAMHAFLCWRIRFEKASLRGEIATRREAPLEMRLEIFRWPANWSACDRAWGHFAQRCLAHELSAAQELREQLGDTDLHRAADRATWMDAVRRASHRFGPARQAWPATVTCFVVEPSIVTRHRQLLLVSMLSGTQRRLISKEIEDGKSC